MAISPLFQRFVDDELALAPALVSRVVAGTVQLLGPSKDGTGGGDRVHYADIVVALQRDAAGYEKTFVESLRRQVAEDLEEKSGGERVDTKSGGLSLELMDETRVDVDIEISRAMQLIDSTADWELRELQTFTSTLIGQNHVTAESNPFRPLTYATALWEAACALLAGHAQRAILLRTSAGVAAGLLKNAAAAASTRLESQGVEPGLYRTVVLPSGGGLGRPVAEAPRQNALSGLLASMPQSGGAATTTGSEGGASAADPGNTRGAGPGASRGGGAAARAPELEQALMRLDQLLRHPPAETSLSGRLSPAQRVEQHRSALIASASQPADRQVIELVSRLFESLLADSSLPAAFRPVVSRMQVAVLRVCLADRSALDAFEHPAWRLLDRIGETSVGYSRSEDPRLSAFLAFAGAVAEEMAGAAHPDTALFRRGLNRIDAFCAEQLQLQLRAARSDTESLQLAERREVLQQHLTQRLTDQMVNMRTSPTIRRFVTGAWARVIASEMLRHGEQSEQTLSAMRTVDDLLWSVKIPDHPQSRQRLVTLLPGLLQRIRTGMEGIALPAAEQRAVLDELMTIHTEALRPGTRAPGATAALPARSRRRRSCSACATRWCPIRPGAQLQRFGDRPVVDGDGAGRAPAHGRRRSQRRPDQADRDDARRRSSAHFPARPLEPRAAALAQRPQPLLSVRGRIAVAHALDHASRPRAARLGRPGAAARGQAARAARRRSDDARSARAPLNAVVWLSARARVRSRR